MGTRGDSGAQPEEPLRPGIGTVVENIPNRLFVMTVYANGANGCARLVVDSTVAVGNDRSQERRREPPETGVTESWGMTSTTPLNEMSMGSWVRSLQSCSAWFLTVARHPPLASAAASASVQVDTWSIT